MAAEAGLPRTLPCYAGLRPEARVAYAAPPGTEPRPERASLTPAYQRTSYPGRTLALTRFEPRVAYVSAPMLEAVASEALQDLEPLIG